MHWYTEGYTASAGCEMMRAPEARLQMYRMAPTGQKMQAVTMYAQAAIMKARIFTPQIAQPPVGGKHTGQSEQEPPPTTGPPVFTLRAIFVGLLWGN
jgi:hypothetical protein